MRAVRTSSPDPNDAQIALPCRPSCAIVLSRESYPFHEVNKALSFFSRGYFAQYDRMLKARAFLWAK